MGMPAALPDTMRWAEQQLIIVDQTKLPQEVAYRAIRSAEEAWEAIRHLRVRGAPAIGITAAYGLYLGVRDWPTPDGDAFFRRLDERIRYLDSARPTAVNLRWALERLRTRAERMRDAEPGALKDELLQEAIRIQQEDEACCRAIGEHALSLLQDGMGILTHCNAGSLATSKWGTATAPLYLARAKGWTLRVYVDETRPVLQGSRLTAWELQQAGLQPVLICDSMAGFVMRRGEIQAAIVGADRIAANGDVANKIGTYSVAVLCSYHRIPFYVAAPYSTVDGDTPDGARIVIEERGAEEITRSFGRPTAPDGIRVYNPAFDITPHELITAIITEKGIIYPPYIGHL